LLNIIKNRITLEKYERVYQAVRKTPAFHFAEQDKVSFIPHFSVLFAKTY